MATKTFDNVGGGDGLWSNAANWIGGVKPVTGDLASIAANCTCNSDESGAILIGVTATTSAKVLTVTTSGHVVTADANFTFQGTLDVNGTGIFEYRTTGATAYTMTVSGSVISTGGGGTFWAKSSANAKATISFNADVTGVAGSRLIIDGWSGVGTEAFGRGYFLTSGLSSRLCSNVEFKRLYDVQPRYSVGARFLNCLIHDCNLGLHPTETAIEMDTCWLYDNVTGITYEGGHIVGVDVVLGKNAADAGAPNTSSDIGGNYFGSGRFYNSKVASATRLAASTNCWYDVVFEKLNQIESSWWRIFGRRHTVESSAGGQSGNCWMIVSSVNTQDNDFNRCRVLIGMIPATDADTIGVTVWVKNAASKTCRIIIDPESLYGTTQNQSGAVAGAVFEQRTVPQYTVATGGGEKLLVPVYIDIIGASETWYVDTLAAVLVGAGENQAVSFEYAFDGVPANEPVAAGGIVHLAGDGGGLVG